MPRATTRRMTAREVIIGVAASDSHVVANQLICMRLELAGIHVTNLGVCTPLTDFADAFDTLPHAEAVLIGSLNGHAHEDLMLLPHLRQAGRLEVPIVLGGNLSVGSVKPSGCRQLLLALGVDHILGNADELLPLLNILRAKKWASTHD